MSVILIARFITSDHPAVVAITMRVIVPMKMLSKLLSLLTQVPPEFRQDHLLFNRASKLTGIYSVQ